MSLPGAGRLARSVLRYAPLVGLAPSPTARPAGISALVRVRNEEEWIEASLVSVSRAVDEIVVVDNGSTDRTPQILARLARTLAPKLRLFDAPRLDYVALSNFTLARASYRWALKWDGDFVARTSGVHAIGGLRERLLALPARRHFHVRLACVELLGDLRHQFPGWEIRHDPFAITLSPGLRYVRVARVVPARELHGSSTILRDGGDRVALHFEDVKVPRYYEVQQWEEAYFFHLQVKNAVRMYLRDCWTDWQENPELQARFPDLEAYGLHRARQAWDVATLPEAAERYMARVGERLVPYSVERFGAYPDLLAPYLT